MEYKLEVEPTIGSFMAAQCKRASQLAALTAIETGMTATEKLLMFHVIGHMHHESGGSCNRTQEQLATELGTTPRQIRRLQRSLEKKGWLIIEPGRNRYGTLRLICFLPSPFPPKFADPLWVLRNSTKE